MFLSDAGTGKSDSSAVGIGADSSAAGRDLGGNAEVVDTLPATFRLNRPTVTTTRDPTTAKLVNRVLAFGRQRRTKATKNRTRPLQRARFSSHERWAPEIPPEEYDRQLTTAIDHLRSINPHARLVIIGPRATYDERPVYERVLEYGKLAGVNEYLAGFYAVPFNRMQQIDDWLRAFSESHDVAYVSPLQLLCKDQICPVVTPAGKIIYWDGSHWTLDGDKYFTQRLVESGVAAEAFRPANK